MLLWREKIPTSWLPKIRSNLPAVLNDHAHLEGVDPDLLTYR